LEQGNPNTVAGERFTRQEIATDQFTNGDKGLSPSKRFIETFSATTHLQSGKSYTSQSVWFRETANWLNG